MCPDASPEGHSAQEPDERVLIERARSGDVEAFEALYRRHVGHIYGLCLRMTGHPDVADDCAQEAFIRGWQKLGSFRGDSRFGTWLHRIAVNEVLGRQRREQRQGPHLTLVGDEGQIEGPSEGLRADEAMDLERAIETLPTGARQVFVLASVYGYSHQEIGGLLNIAVGSSKAQLHRARKLLSGRLGL